MPFDNSVDIDVGAAVAKLIGDLASSQLNDIAALFLDLIDASAERLKNEVGGGNR